MKRPRQTTPLFCPNCRKASTRAVDSMICAHCGDRLIPKGYCPVCERFLDVPPGENCPKHEVSLETDGPIRLGELVGETPFVWVEVGRFADTLACQPPRIRLEAEGIPTVIDGERMGDRSMYQVATGGVRLLAPEHLAGDARIILSQTWTATADALGVEDDWPEFDDEPPESKPPWRNPSILGPSTLSYSYLELLAVGLVLLLAALMYLH